MARRLLVRRVTAVLIGSVLAFAANLPPEHGHPSQPGHAAIVHRHASLHVVGNPLHPKLGDNDGAIIWIDASYLSNSTPAGHANATVTESPVSGVPVMVVQRALLDSQATGIHGPPGRPSSPRAPPTSLSL